MAYDICIQTHKAVVIHTAIVQSCFSAGSLDCHHLDLVHISLFPSRIQCFIPNCLFVAFFAGTSTPSFGQSAAVGPIPFGSPGTPVQGFNAVPFGRPLMLGCFFYLGHAVSGFSTASL